jgi:hypothetical protein
MLKLLQLQHNKTRPCVRHLPTALHLPTITHPLLTSRRYWSLTSCKSSAPAKQRKTQIQTRRTPSSTSLLPKRSKKSGNLSLPSSTRLCPRPPLLSSRPRPRPFHQFPLCLLILLLLPLSLPLLSFPRLLLRLLLLPSPLLLQLDQLQVLSAKISPRQRTNNSSQSCNPCSWRASWPRPRLSTFSPPAPPSGRIRLKSSKLAELKPLASNSLRRCPTLAPCLYLVLGSHLHPYRCLSPSLRLYLRHTTSLR